MGNVNAFQSDVTFKGATTTCSNCRVYTSDDLRILNNATVTVSTGAAITADRLYIGSSAAGGHLKTTPYTGVSTEKPKVTTSLGIHLQGTSTQKSSVDIDGLRIVGAQVGGGSSAITFYSQYEVKKIDNLTIVPGGAGSYSVYGNIAFKIAGCSGSIFTATTFNNIEFAFLPYYGKTVTYDSTSCTAITLPVITISGNGQSFGKRYEEDPINRILWTNGASFHCTWTGTTDTSWTEPTNWSNCANGRGNYPSGVDGVTIPAAATNQPVVDGTQYIEYINGSNGTITINASSTLYLGSNGWSNIDGAINFQGATAGCTTCQVRLWNQDPRVNGTLGLGTGINIQTNVYYGFEFGDKNGGGYTGHLKTIHASTVSSEWPLISSIHSDMPTSVIFRGFSTASRSSIDVNGLRLSGISEVRAANGRGIYLHTNWNIIRFDNVILNTTNTTNSYTSQVVRITNCTNSLMGDKNWDGIDFIDGLTGAGKNIWTDCTSLPGGGTLEMTPLTGGTNAGYGAAFETDASNLINWN
jgi:hypothetical protein